MSVAAGHSQSVIPGARFMDPAVLARIGNLELVSRAVVDGFINGMHKAPYFGASVDFAEHRGPSRTRTSRCCSTCRSR
jgi:hypothetical protein